MLAKSLLLSSIASLVAAQFPPTPEGVKLLKSKFHENVTISFKETGLCETNPGVKSYAGHVHLPPGLLEDIKGVKQNYPINTFFWFFESRHDPANAPLAIWLNGGPGSSSMLGLLQEHGPCFIADDSKTTINNPWAWNNNVNMLFIDEPNQVGFSYDIPTNATVTPESIIPTDFSNGIPKLNVTTRVGTVSSQKKENTAHSTEEAAHALWHFAQTFFTEFPYYKPNNDRISLWAESYGGHYGPGFVRFFQQQNEKIRDGSIGDHTAHYLHLDTLGIINGYIDSIIQEEAKILFPYINTYGVKGFNQSTFEGLMHNFTSPGGCRDQLVKCQEKLKKSDDSGINTMTTKEKFCEMEENCVRGAEHFYHYNDNARFDITHPKADPFPPPHLYGWLTEESVLRAIGSPVNFTQSPNAVGESFEATGDKFLGGFLDAVGYLLDSGVKVHMMYGDRDFACNWIGGENSSLAIPYSRINDFKKAGYADVTTSEGSGGLVRQFGNFSFTRVFQAGHEIPSYQPVTAYEIFMRATFNRDIATGLLPVHDEYSTVGPKSTWHVLSKVEKAPKPKCYVLDSGTCTPEVWKKVVAGKVTIKDYFVVDEESEEQIGNDEL